jgi:hypothetical protein
MAPITGFLTSPVILFNKLFIIQHHPSGISNIKSTQWSADGITWTESPLFKAATTVTSITLIIKSSTVAMMSVGQYIFTTRNGKTWALVYDAAGIPIYGSAYHGKVGRTTKGLFVFAHGSGYIYTTEDGCNISARTFPVTSGGLVSVVPSEATGNFYLITDGGAWVTPDGTNFSNHSCAETNFYGIDSKCGYFKYVSLIGPNMFVYRATVDTPAKFRTSIYQWLNCVLKAQDVDGSVKKVLVDMSKPGYLVLRSAEDIGYDTFYNPIAETQDVANAQQVNITAGGVMNLFANINFIAAYSYLPATAFWGSTAANSISMIVDMNRDDPWCTAASGYPKHGHFFNNGTAIKFTMPRYKAWATNDILDSNSYLQPFVHNPLTGQVINGSNVLVPPCMDLYVYGGPMNNSAFREMTLILLFHSLYK